MKEFEKYIDDKIVEMDSVAAIPIEELRYLLLMERQKNKKLSEALQKIKNDCEGRCLINSEMRILAITTKALKEYGNL